MHSVTFCKAVPGLRDRLVFVGHGPFPMKHVSVFLFALLLMHLPSHAQTDGNREAVIARAGNVFVSEREFLERFELTPGSHRRTGSSLEAAKLTTLYSMVAEKLLAREALGMDLDRNETFQSAMLELTKLLARDELYHLEVARKISVSSEDLKRGIARARTELLVSFLFFDTEEDDFYVYAGMGGR